jgi:hypothetical protein
VIQYCSAISALSGWSGLLNHNGKISADNFNVTHCYERKGAGVLLFRNIIQFYGIVKIQMDTSYLLGIKTTYL